MTKPPVLELHDVTISYDAQPAVEQVDLRFEGGLLVLVGESGCGKTTLLRAISGFECPDRGKIRVAGTTMSGGGKEVAPERRGIGMVFQEGALFPHLTVWENVRYGVRGAAAGEQRAREMLELVRLESLADRFPDQLSGGQQQRVALARALAPDPRLVLLDEPFSGLDAGLRAHVRQEVRSVLEKTRTDAVLVTHDREEALSIADQVAVMVRGRVLQVGTPERVYARPASAEVARFMGSGELLPCTVQEGRVECAVGSARCSAPNGPGRLLLRPEDLHVELLGTGDEKVVGRLQDRRFFGHDALDEIVLANGETVQARVLTGDTLPLGSTVSLRLRERLYEVFSDSGDKDSGEAPLTDLD